MQMFFSLKGVSRSKNELLLALRNLQMYLQKLYYISWPMNHGFSVKSLSSGSSSLRIIIIIIFFHEELQIFSTESL